jgi:IS5 family transposase
MRAPRRTIRKAPLSGSDDAGYPRHNLASTARARALDILRTAREAVPRAGTVRLPAAYLRDIRRVEARRDNRDGSDKSWVERFLADSRRHYTRARRVR